MAGSALRTTPPNARSGPWLWEGANWTFAGSRRGADRAAVMLTLITTARHNDIDPKTWLADVLARIADLPTSHLHDLLPWEWKRLREADKPADQLAA
jgi:transposase